MNHTKWSRARFATDRPSKRKKRDFDGDNSYAANLILESPEQHPAFMVAWAQRFTRRLTAEGSEVDRTQRNQQPSGQLPLNLQGVSRETAKIPTTWPM